ncbi:ubiquitin-like small modifier protein 1 [Halodesulfurarchaeum sp. HSR-GB]|uniref:ubiquitin-like small modifier protein 1 n=1 Tax=Halodesulfurarchaeum sp. HSR-GB TaxID=3074077 RepID=UPI0028626487|nr:ubiquitin-like small modifier protein 1 [Halodesulfurarchaeum sp. HSR-GB]MDR5656346.1 ubiquitin-like small modifier protein 1 [Halodesulfurarchaeum sp. HSR-GB]
MEWKLFADLAETAGEKRVAVDPAPEPTVEDALEALFESHPALRDRVLADGEVADHVNLLLNGESVADRESGLGTQVESGDELALFPPVSGG